jgi:gas vesicle protein
MRRRSNGDASFLIGLVLGVFIGAAVTIIISPQVGEEYRTLLTDRADKALTSLEKLTGHAHPPGHTARVQGAAEGGSPPAAS